MSALSYLQQKNGLKTTQTVVNKQQSGEDAEQKANPVLQASTLTESQLQDAGKKIDNANNAASQDDAMKERTVATQQAIQKGVNVNQDADPENDDDISNIPVVKQDVTPKRMSYADMFKAMYGNGEEETEEQKKKQDTFYAENKDGEDPMKTMMMSMYMLGALEYFDGMDKMEIKKIAFEIAMIGTTGISPDKKSGYKVPSIPGKDFGGYQLLAYYYVSWALAIPEMLASLNLPFDNAWAAAQQMWKKKKGNQ